VRDSSGTAVGDEIRHDAAPPDLRRSNARLCLDQRTQNKPKKKKVVAVVATHRAALREN
jgi:hypothetical protein